jgi:hypothetical protein
VFHTVVSNYYSSVGTNDTLLSTLEIRIENGLRINSFAIRSKSNPIRFIEAVSYNTDSTSLNIKSVYLVG